MDLIGTSKVHFKLKGKVVDCSIVVILNVEVQNKTNYTYFVENLERVSKFISIFHENSTNNNLYRINQLTRLFYNGPYF